MFGDGPKKCNWIEICYSFFVVAALFFCFIFFSFFFFARGSNKQFYFTFTAQACQFTREEMTEVLIVQAWVGLDFLANVAKGWVSSCLKNVKPFCFKSLHTEPFTDCAICLQTNFFPGPAIITDLTFWYKCCPYTKSKSAGNLLIPGDNVEETVQVNGLCKSSA